MKGFIEVISGQEYLIGVNAITSVRKFDDRSTIIEYYTLEKGRDFTLGVTEIKVIKTYDEIKEMIEEATSC